MNQMSLQHLRFLSSTHRSLLEFSLARLKPSLFTGTIPVTLQLRPEGPVEKPAAGGSHQTLRQP